MSQYQMSAVRYSSYYR